MTDPSQLLCTRCGLCCDGSLFADVELRDEGESVAVEAMGLEVEDSLLSHPLPKVGAILLQGGGRSRIPLEPDDPQVLINEFDVPNIPFVHNIDVHQQLESILIV